MPTKPHIECDSCGASMTKAHAVYEGIAYCDRCYFKIFSATKCDSCGLTVKTPHGRGPALCKHCKTLNRTCIRCGKPVPRAGLVVDEGVVCPSCVRYFKAPKECPNCGHISHHLSRDIKNGFTEPVCERCRRQGYITCAECGKNRRGVGINHAGKAICSICAERNGAPFICPQCKRPGRRHSSTRCERCYWHESAGKRYEKALEQIATPWVRREFSQFFDELFDHYEAKVISLKLEKYISFFKQLSTDFYQPDTLSYRSLVHAYGGNRVRQAVVPVNYLIKQKIIDDASPDERSMIIEENIQQRLLTKTQELWYGNVLTRYNQHQRSVIEKFRSRGWKGKMHRPNPMSATKAIVAAYRFLVYSTQNGISSTHELSQTELDKFLGDHPGYNNAIRNFVGYLNREGLVFNKLSLNWTSPNIPKDAFVSPERYEYLMKTWLSSEGKATRISLICVLMGLYAQSIKKVLSIKLSDLLIDEEKNYKVFFGKIEITLDPTVSALMFRYLEYRHANAPLEREWENPYLFPGRNKGNPLSSITVTIHIKKFGVNAKSLFATAMQNAYLSGIRQPKVLVKAFGVSLISAMKYYNAFDPRLVDEIVTSTKDNG